MSLLPARNIFDGSKLPVTTTGEMKSALGTLRDFLAGLFGVDGADKAGARAVLGAAPIAPNILPKNIAGGVAIALTAAEALNDILVFTGAITADIPVVVPNTAKEWIVKNGTTGLFKVTLETAAGAGVAVAQGRARQVYCDGIDVLAAMTDFTDNPPPVVPLPVAIRQAINSGPVDANGFFAPGGATGSATVTTTAISSSAPLVVNAAGGNTATGGLGDRIGVSVANLAFTGLSTNGTMFLYADVAANGALTPGAGTLLPNYQRGGTFSITSGQFTYNSNVKMQTIGTGAAAPQSFRVYLGEVTVAGGVVTAILWYRLNNKFDCIPFPNPNVAASTSNVNHQLGLPFHMLKTPTIKAILTAASDGWPSGSLVGVVSGNSFSFPPVQITDRNVATIQAGASAPNGFYYMATSGGTAGLPAASNLIVTVEGDL